MADLYLPETPLPKQASILPVVPGGWQTPPTGGIETWLGFMGARFSLGLVTPNLMPEPGGRLWSAALLDGLQGGKIVGCRFLQPGFASQALPAGDTVVHGNGQAGSVLTVRGFQANAVFQRREFFSLVSGGRRYLHYVAADTGSADGAHWTLPIAPMLRVQPADGDFVEFITPMIEGKLTAQDGGYTLIPGKMQSLSFTITETR